MDIGSPQLTVRRPVYQQDELHQVCDYTRPKKKIREKVSKRCERFDLKDFTKRSIPLLNWLVKYQWKKDISGDIVAGVTVAVMHIPQGMGYAMLGNVPPVIGIYMAVFPVLIYTLLGTSRHNSMGSFAVVSLMIGKVVLAKSNVNSVSLLNTTNVTSTLLETDLETGTPTYTPTEVATIITFVVGMIQLAMYLLRLGVVSTLLSETLVSGFTTGSAMHVMTSQVKDLLGLKMGKRVGIFKIVLTYYDVFANFDNINVTAVILSACTIVILTLNNQLLKPLLASKCIVPVPIEAIVVVLGTILSIYMNLAEKHGVLIVGEIPVGLPSPTVPKFELVPELWFDCVIITVVSYAISMSMALIFAQRNNYEVDSNQELVAQGAGNVFGSFFSCMPFSASLSRSSIQEMVGGRTQLASLISCSLLICILLWVGPFFEPLPKCILSSIIVVALKGMLLQVTEFIRFWRLSRVDAAVWMVTFLTVVFLDVEWGLLVGLFISVASLIGFSMSPYSCRVGLVPGTEIYLDVKRYKGTIQIPGIDVLHYCGCLNFASRQHFRSEVYKIAGCEPQKILSRRRKIAERATTQPQAKESFEKGYINEGYDRELGDESPGSNSPKLKAIVIDFSALVYIDPAGVATLRSLVDEFKKIDVVVYIAGCSGPVFETMRKCNVADGKEGHFTMFPTISDAVNFALHEPRLSLIPMASPTCGIFSSPVLPVNPTIQRILPDEDECTSRL